MRKVALGQRYTQNKMLFFRAVPRSGVYTNRTENVMDLKLNTWKDHYAPNAYASLEDAIVRVKGGTYEWFLERSEDETFTLLDATWIVKQQAVSISPTFNVKKADGTNLYWIPQCAVPKSYGDRISISNTKSVSVCEMIPREELADEENVSTISAIKFVGKIFVDAKKINITHTMFSSYPWIEPLRKAFEKIYLINPENPDKFDAIQGELQNILDEEITSQRMYDWCQNNEISIGAGYITCQDVSLTGYLVDDQFAIQPANTPEYYMIDKCPCVVSTDIASCENGELTMNDVEQDEEVYVTFHKIALTPLVIMTTPAMDVRWAEPLSFVKVNATNKDYVRSSSFVSLWNYELNWTNYEASPLYTAKKFLHKVVLYSTPRRVNKTFGYDTEGNLTSVEQILAYCPDMNLYIGDHRTVVFPNTILWADDGE